MSQVSYKNECSQEEMYERWSELLGFFRIYPDIFLEWLTPTEVDEETGEVRRIGITLGGDQKIFLRAMARFASTFFVFPRGFGKTTLELLAVYVFAILYPGTSWSMSAQSLQNSAKFFKDKHADICRFYPMIEKEIESVKISNNDVYIEFKSGSVVTNITNGSNSKGLRRHGIIFEEVALMKFSDYRDNTQPITAVNQKSQRYMSTDDPFVQNRQGFVTTAYYKNEAYDFCRQLVLDMANCNNAFVFGASYRLASKFKRDKPQEEIELEIDRIGQLMFNFNYGSRWAVTNGSCIVDMEKFKELQTLAKPEMKAVKGGEYYISIDVARSAKSSNNASAITVLKVLRDARQKVRQMQLVNVIKLPNGMNFREQSIICKKLVKIYNAQALIVDINGLGVGLLDYLLDSQILDDGEELEPLDSMNLEIRSSYQYAKRLVYGIQAQKNNSEMIVNFISCVETKLLRLLEQFDVYQAAGISDEDYMISEVLPYLRTENLIAEVQNLTVEQIPSSNKLKVGQLVRMDKDIYSSLLYNLWYIMSECNSSHEEEEEDIMSVLRGMIRKPKIR